MNATRRNFILGGAAAAALPGCRTVPGADVTRLAARGIGSATGLALNECDLPDGVRNRIIEIAGVVLKVVPKPGQALEDVWAPIARTHVDGLVAAGTIDKATGEVVVAAVRLVIKGYTLVELRHPKVRIVRELAEAALTGFGEGLLAAMKPVNALEAVPVDVEAFRAIRATDEFHAFKLLAAPARGTFR